MAFVSIQLEDGLIWRYHESFAYMLDTFGVWVEGQAELGLSTMAQQTQGSRISFMAAKSNERVFH